MDNFIEVAITPGSSSWQEGPISSAAVCDTMSKWSKQLGDAVEKFAQGSSTDKQFLLLVASVRADIERAIMWEISKLYPMRNFAWQGESCTE